MEIEYLEVDGENTPLGRLTLRAYRAEGGESRCAFTLIALLACCSPMTGSADRTCNLSTRGAWLRVRLVSGASQTWTCHASEVDALTGDPAFIAPVGGS